jgi:hypothetical protein
MEAVVLLATPLVAVVVVVVADPAKQAPPQDIAAETTSLLLMSWYDPTLLTKLSCLEFVHYNCLFGLQSSLLSRVMNCLVMDVDAESKATSLCIISE